MLRSELTCVVRLLYDLFGLRLRLRCPQSSLSYFGVVLLDFHAEFTFRFVFEQVRVTNRLCLVLRLLALLVGFGLLHVLDVFCDAHVCMLLFIFYFIICLRLTQLLLLLFGLLLSEVIQPVSALAVELLETLHR